MVAERHAHRHSRSGPSLQAEKRPNETHETSGKVWRCKNKCDVTRRTDDVLDFQALDCGQRSTIRDGKHAGKPQARAPANWRTDNMFMSVLTTRLATFRCTNTSPGLRPRIVFALTRESEQPIHRSARGQRWVRSGTTANTPCMMVMGASRNACGT